MHTRQRPGWFPETYRTNHLGAQPAFREAEAAEAHAAAHGLLPRARGAGGGAPESGASAWRMFGAEFFDGIARVVGCVYGVGTFTILLQFL